MHLHLSDRCSALVTSCVQLHLPGRYNGLVALHVQLFLSDRCNGLVALHVQLCLSDRCRSRSKTPAGAAHCRWGSSASPPIASAFLALPQPLRNRPSSSRDTRFSFAGVRSVDFEDRVCNMFKNLLLRSLNRKLISPCCVCVFVCLCMHLE